MTYFNQLIKLTGVLAFAIRTIYTINRSKLHLGYSDDWETRKGSHFSLIPLSVASLTTRFQSMNSMLHWLTGSICFLFIVSILHFLDRSTSPNVRPIVHWDARIEDQVLFDQSALLGLVYYYVQMAIYRPFIPALAGGKQGSPLAFSSLIACTRAARSASCILETRLERSPWEVSAAAIMTSFTAGTMILVSIWGINKTGLAIDVTGHIQDFHKCIASLQAAEKR